MLGQLTCELLLFNVRLRTVYTTVNCVVKSKGSCYFIISLKVARIKIRTSITIDSTLFFALLLDRIIARFVGISFHLPTIFILILIKL